MQFIENDLYVGEPYYCFTPSMWFKTQTIANTWKKEQIAKDTKSIVFMDFAVDNMRNALIHHVAKKWKSRGQHFSEIVKLAIQKDENNRALMEILEDVYYDKALWKNPSDKVLTSRKEQLAIVEAHVRALGSPTPETSNVSNLPSKKLQQGDMIAYWFEDSKNSGASGMYPLLVLAVEETKGKFFVEGIDITPVTPHFGNRTAIYLNPECIKEPIHFSCNGGARRKELEWQYLYFDSMQHRTLRDSETKTVLKIIRELVRQGNAQDIGDILTRMLLQ